MQRDRECERGSNIYQEIKLKYGEPYVCLLYLFASLCIILLDVGYWFGAHADAREFRWKTANGREKSSVSHIAHDQSFVLNP